MVIELIAYTIVGLGAGLLGGLLGMSGGIITVPCLVLIFTLMKFPTIDLMQLAIGTSLAAMVFNAISAAYSHNKMHGVKWSLLKTMLPGVILGCIAGAFCSHILSTPLLEIIFGIFALCFGFYFYKHKRLPKVHEHTLPSKKALNGVGFIVGAVSNILGIGGGTLMVPIFVGYRMPMKNAMGTSIAMGFFISLAGAISFLIFGLGETYYDYTIGYIYLPAFAILAVTTFFTAPYGARLSHRIKSDTLKKYFALCLMIVGLFMIFGL